MSFSLVFAKACPLYKFGDRFTLTRRSVRFSDAKPACLVLVQDLTRLFVTLVTLNEKEQEGLLERKFSCSGCSGLVKFQVCDKAVVDAGNAAAPASAMNPGTGIGRKAISVDVGFSGALDDIPISDILQILHMQHRTGIMTLYLQHGKGLLLLKEGSLLEAVYGEARGKEAFFAIIAAQEGSFTFVSGELDDKFKYKKKLGNFMMLLLDAMKSKDG